MTADISHQNKTYIHSYIHFDYSSSYIDKKEEETLSSDIFSEINFNNNLYSDKTFNIEYIYDDFKIDIPHKLSYLIKAYENSEYILNLEEDFDDNGSPSYKKETWINSINFVTFYSTNILDKYNKRIECPKIYHGPTSSIDILFENDNYSLLINIQEDSNKAIYFGKDKIGNTTKGEIILDKINFNLIPILTNL